MFHRPLIPILFAFAGGILVAHKGLAPCQGLALPMFISITLCLFAILFLSSRLRLALLLITFFFTGILVDSGKHHSSELLPWAINRQKVTIEGTVLEPARISDKIARLKVRAQRLFAGGKSIRINDNILVTVYNNIPHITPGDKVRFPARLRPFKNFNNPGGYDYESAMKLKGLTCAASVSDGRRIVPMGPGLLPFPGALLEKIQRPVRDLFSGNLGPEDEALFRALILGERQGISRQLREPFNRTGLGHVLAVSGLHIGLVAWISFFFFKSILSRSYKLVLKTDIQKLTALLTCVPVIGYTCLAGFQVSSQRAMIMVLAFLCSLILRREKEVWSTLALAGLIILAVDPHALFSLSFQLSFSAVVGILWLTPSVLKIIPSPHETPQRKMSIFNNISLYFIGLIAVSISATLFLLPIISFYFHRVSLVTIPANLTVVPILGLWIIPNGLLSAVILPFSAQAANLFLHLGAWGLHAIMEIIRFWSGLSWASAWVVTPNLFEMLMFYALILFIFFFKRRAWARVGLAVLTVFILVDIGYWTYRVHFNRDLKVTFLDVGQANAALVEFPGGQKMLIDGGGFPSDRFDVGKMVVAPFLWHSKIKKIDYLVLSHPQSDHMNGLRFIAKEFQPKEFWYNGDDVKTASFKELMAIIESKKIKRLLPVDLVEGRKINEAKIDYLYPPPVRKKLNLFYNGTRLNNNSLVLKISFNGKSFLFPGDLEREGEALLVSSKQNALKSDVLLSPHHGSRSSSTREFLRMVKPGICVISSGQGNFFGFPHEQTLKRLRDIGCRAIRIDRSGAVQCTVGPNDRFEVRTFIKNRTF
ncbi:MAG: DNA internalization-related competence protein ComEC/Rec2 [Deltaproteobacteria bacterium]|nr:DNA internalization-related competence protein ComEC/Rec2 [Deltaproteobacteria bacterium]